MLTTMLFNKITELRDKEVGRRAFVIANGPSINVLNLGRMKGELVIGMNASTLALAQYGVKAQYYVCSDQRFIQHTDKRRFAVDDLPRDTVRVFRKELKEVYLLGCDLRYRDDQPRFYKETHPQIEDQFTSVQLHNIIGAAEAFEQRGGALHNCSEFSFLRPYIGFLPYDTIWSEAAV